MVKNKLYFSILIVFFVQAVEFDTYLSVIKDKKINFSAIGILGTMAFFAAKINRIVGKESIKKTQKEKIFDISYRNAINKKKLILYNQI
jgi:hypothetical protein